MITVKYENDETGQIALFTFKSEMGNVLDINMELIPPPVNDMIKDPYHIIEQLTNMLINKPDGYND